MLNLNKLSRAEMKNVKGGNEPVPCTVLCYQSGGLIATVRTSTCSANPVTFCPGGIDFPNPPAGGGIADSASCSCNANGNP